MIEMNTRQINVKKFLENELANCPYQYTIDVRQYGNLYIRFSVDTDKVSTDDDMLVSFLERVFVGEPYQNITVHTFTGDKHQALKLAELIVFAINLIGKYKLINFNQQHFENLPEG